MIYTSIAPPALGISRKNAQRNHHPVNLRTKLLKVFASKLDSSKKLAF